MRLSMRITFDGLVRALRMQAHGLADELAVAKRGGKPERGARLLAASKPRPVQLEKSLRAKEPRHGGTVD